MTKDKLFNYLLDEHGIAVLDSDMNEIINICREIVEKEDECLPDLPITECEESNKPTPLEMIGKLDFDRYRAAVKGKSGWERIDAINKFRSGE